ncbi:hypothetical protein [Kitasatospora sp. HPMI-4]|uniref:hypothetical protein n=1 Tax=Kitasatospora sp. HPMI-4 TaxID=3448443 RepID=UPI003F1E17B6
MTGPALPEDADRLLRGAAGSYELVGVRSRDRSGRPAVWEVRTDGGQRLFAKRHKNELMHRRETAAYRHLAPALGPDRAPTLLAEDARSLLVVTTPLPGTPAIEAALSPAEEREVYRQAGHLGDSSADAGDDGREGEQACAERSHGGVASDHLPGVMAAQVAQQGRAEEEAGRPEQSEEPRHPVLCRTSWQPRGGA